MFLNVFCCLYRNSCFLTWGWGYDIHVSYSLSPSPRKYRIVRTSLFQLTFSLRDTSLWKRKQQTYVIYWWKICLYFLMKWWSCLYKTRSIYQMTEMKKNCFVLECECKQIEKSVVAENRLYRKCNFIHISMVSGRLSIWPVLVYIYQ